MGAVLILHAQPSPVAVELPLLGDELVDPGRELGHDPLGLHLVDGAVLAHLQDPVLLLEYLADRGLTRVSPVRLGLILGLPRLLGFGLLDRLVGLVDLVVPTANVGVLVADVLLLLGPLVQGLLDALAALGLAHVDHVVRLVCGRFFGFATWHFVNHDVLGVRLRQGSGVPDLHVGVGICVGVVLDRGKRVALAQSLGV